MGEIANLLRQYWDDVKWGGSLNPELPEVTAEDIGSLALDFTPVAGGVKGTKENIESGDYAWAAVDAATVPMDLLSLGMAGTLARALRKGDVAIDALEEARRAKAADMGYDFDDKSKWIYHGTRSPDIREIETNRYSNDMDAFYTSKDPEFASSFAGEDEGSIVYPLILRKDAKIFDPTDAEQRQSFIDAMFDRNALDYEEPLHYTFADKEAEGWYNADEMHDVFKNADWNAMETPEVEATLKNMGYDGFKIREAEGLDPNNIGILNTNKLRSPFADFDPAKRDSSDMLAAALRQQQNYV